MPGPDPVALLEAGRRLAPLRQEAVLIIGSGFMTHNLRLARFGVGEQPPPAWSAAFDAWANESVGEREIDALVDFEHKAPAARIAHPTTDHFVPLFVSLVAALERPYEARALLDGHERGLSKHSYQ